MKEPIGIEIVCDGGPAVGLGHVRRSHSLAWSLKESAFRVRLRTMEPFDLATTGLDFPNDSGQVALRLFDTPLPCESLLLESQRQGLGTIALDYFGDVAPDLVISVVEHFTPRVRGQRVSGFEYIIIRDDILKCRGQNVVDAAGALVLVGGGDVTGVGGLAASRFVELEQDVTWIRGPLTPTLDAHKVPPRVTVLSNPPNIGALIQKCRWGAANGGGSLFEMMYLGKPVVVLPQTEREMTIARQMLERGGVLGIGIDGMESVPQETLEAVGARAQAIVDGKGLARICQLVRNVSCKK